MRKYLNFIDGQWCNAISGQTFDAINPAKGEPFARIAKGSRQDAQKAIAAANAAQSLWRKVPLWERAALCHKMAELVVQYEKDLADILCTELGKPRHGEAIDEAREVATNFRQAAELAKFLEGQTIPTQDPHKRVLTFRQPRGVIAVITPWNFPAAIATEYLPHAIVMGNTVVWTPAPTAAATAVVLMEIIARAGLPKGVINLVLGPGNEVGDELVINRSTHAIGMTGSPKTGLTISSRAGLKPKLMELGGNGPTIILPDADPVKAAQMIAPACFYAAGQVCSCAERILVADNLKQDFVDEMIRQARSWVQGDPWDTNVNMGPQNSMMVVDKMTAHLLDASAKGAKILVGGGRPKLPGFFYEPTVLVDYAIDSLVNKEETFGPIAPIAAFKNDQQAWDYINACDFGLVSAVFTRDVDKAWQWADNLRTGITVVNDFTNYWELHIPFGGMSGTQSGLGRIGGRHTLEFMSDLKTIAFNIG
ncbi:MAG: aldehyde dehydrogenase [Phycisphaerales bacterium]|nr:aldehyde dehydrogenase [Phycisphaerales bacterium]